MRWSIVTLVVVGIIAALSAALLVGALKAGNRPSGALLTTPEATVVVAAKDLPANAVVDAKSLVTKNLPKDKLPANAITDPVQAIGKVLVNPVLEGQPLSKTSFAPDTAGVELAAQLKPGMRAVGVAVSDHAGLAGILYPGCWVDVMVSVRASPTEENATSISTTLLENVQVLAIEKNTLVTAEGDRKAEGDSFGRSRKVTLAVNTHQAKELQLAQEIGTLSLAMRNPRDNAPTDKDLVSLKAIAGPGAAADARFAAWTAAIGGAAPKPVATKPAPAASNPVPATTAHMETASTAQAAPGWDLTVIRGAQVETKTFPMPEK